MKRQRYMLGKEVDPLKTEEDHRLGEVYAYLCVNHGSWRLVSSYYGSVVAD